MGIGEAANALDFDFNIHRFESDMPSLDVAALPLSPSKAAAFKSQVIPGQYLCITSRTLSSVGQSIRLITERSRVRVPQCPSFFFV